MAPLLTIAAPSGNRVRSGSDGGGSGGEDEPKLLKAVNVSTAPEVETAGMQLVAGSAVPVGQALHLQCELPPPCRRRRLFRRRHPSPLVCSC